MVLAMTRPTRRDNSTVFQFKRRVSAEHLATSRGRQLFITLPESVGHPAKAMRVRVGAVVKFSLHTREPAVAKTRAAAVNEQLDATWATIARGPRSLSQKQIVALAGSLYTAFAEAFEQDPGPSSRWERVLRANIDAQVGNSGDSSLLIGAPGRAESVRQSMEARFGALLDATLAKHCVIPDAASRDKLLHETARHLNAAAIKAKANAEGDYSADPHANSIPPWTKQDGTSGRPLGLSSITGIFNEWVKHVVPSKKLVKTTVDGYRHAFKLFTSFLGHDDFQQLSDESVVRFAEHRVATGRSPRTVNEGDLSALKAVFGWAVKSKRITHNPATGVRVPEAKKTRVRGTGFTDGEALSILRASNAYEQKPNESDEVAAAKRWVPWIAAFTGARIGEIVQLRKKDIERDGDHWVMTISPEAGSVKNRQIRKVPLHPQLIALGFVAFVSDSSTTLFRKSNKPNGTPLTRGGVINRVRDFVRSIVPDPNVQPNHGWRHRFITQARIHKLDQELRRMILGHAGQGVDETTYGDAAGLYEEICKLPPYAV